MDSAARRWNDRWQALRGPASFGLGALLLIYEGAKAWTGRPVDGELVIVASGLCGLPMFTPATREGD